MSEINSSQEMVNDLNPNPETSASPATLTAEKKTFTFDPLFILTAISSIVLILILILHFPSKPKPVQWEYKSYKFSALGYDRTGSEAGKSSTVILSEEKLNEFGKDGWELVSTSLEMETSYPNFGNASYVTGLQPNVRPQTLICIFKKPIKETK